MGIFQRISDIVMANLNDLVDGYEEPDKMLRQAIREMQVAISDARPDVARAMANSKTIARELSVNEAQCENWADRAQKAVESGDDDLARKAIARKKDYEKIVAALKDQKESADHASDMLRRQYEGMQAKLKEAQRRLDTLTVRQKAAEVQSKFARSQVNLASDLDQHAIEKFERLSRKVDRAEAEAEALAELARSEISGESADRKSATNDTLEIEAELMEFKRRANIPPR